MRIFNLSTGSKIINSLLPVHAQERQISYGKHADMKLDVFGKKSKHFKPVIIFWHGGGWKQGSGSEYQFIANYIEKMGAIAVIVGYPRFPDQTFSGFIDDARQALKWCRSNIDSYGGDPDRLYVMGHSSGAHTASVLALQDKGKLIKGCILFAVPVKILRKYWLDVFGKENFDKGLENPLSYVTKSKTKFLLIHGASDKIVSCQDSVKLNNKLHSEGVESEIIIVNKIGHALILATIVRPFAYFFGIGKQIKEFIN